MFTTIHQSPKYAGELLTALPPEKVHVSNFRDLFSEQLHELYVAEQQLLKGRNVIALAIVLMLAAAGAIAFAELTRLNRAEIHYQLLLNQRDVAVQSVQSNLTEVTQERDLAVGYIGSLQTKLTDVTRERNVALGDDLPKKGTLEVNP